MDFIRKREEWGGAHAVSNVRRPRTAGGFQSKHNSGTEPAACGERIIHIETLEDTALRLHFFAPKRRRALAEFVKRHIRLQLK